MVFIFGYIQGHERGGQHMESNGMVYGKIPVKNALEGRRKPIRLFLNRDHPDKEIQSLASRKGVSYKLVDEKELSRLSGGNNHQGAVLLLPAFEYVSLDDVLSQVSEKKDSTIVMLDGIEDPVNFGSIIRTSCAFACDAIIIRDKRQVQVTPTVSKIATGAEDRIPICRVPNLNQAMDILKKNGYWIVCSAGEGKDAFDEIDYNGKIVLVVGSEGFGASQIVKKNADYLASIPLEGEIKALNASIACAVFLSQIASCRRRKDK